MLLVQCTNLFLLDREFHSCDLLVGLFGLFYVNLDFSFQSQYYFIDRDVLLQNRRSRYFLKILLLTSIFLNEKRNYIFLKFQSLQCLPGSWSPPWQLLLQLRKSRLETSRHFIMRQGMIIIFVIISKIVFFIVIVASKIFIIIILISIVIR